MGFNITSCLIINELQSLEFRNIKPTKFKHLCHALLIFPSDFVSLLSSQHNSKPDTGNLIMLHLMKKVRNMITLSIMDSSASHCYLWIPLDFHHHFIKLDWKLQICGGIRECKRKDEEKRSQ